MEFVKIKRGEKTKAPVFRRCCHSNGMQTHKTIEVGDHILVVGEVVNAIKFKDEAPIFLCWNIHGECSQILVYHTQGKRKVIYISY